MRKLTVHDGLQPTIPSDPHSRRDRLNTSIFRPWGRVWRERGWLGHPLGFAGASERSPEPARHLVPGPLAPHVVGRNSFRRSPVAARARRIEMRPTRLRAIA